MAAGLLVAAHGLAFAVVDSRSSWSRRTLCSISMAAPAPYGGEYANRRSLASRDSRRPAKRRTRSILQYRLHGWASVGPSTGWSTAHRDHPVAPPLPFVNKKKRRFEDLKLKVVKGATLNQGRRTVNRQSQQDCC